MVCFGPGVGRVVFCGFGVVLCWVFGGFRWLCLLLYLQGDVFGVTWVVSATVTSASSDEFRRGRSSVVFHLVLFVVFWV